MKDVASPRSIETYLRKLIYRSSLLEFEKAGLASPELTENSLEFLLDGENECRNVLCAVEGSQFRDWKHELEARD